MNQVAGVVGLASELHSYFGILVLVLAIAGIGILTLYPLFLWWRMPPALVPPEDKDSAAYEDYLQACRKRLQTNSHVLEAGIDVIEENGQLQDNVMECANTRSDD